MKEQTTIDKIKKGINSAKGAINIKDSLKEIQNGNTGWQRIGGVMNIINSIFGK